MYSQPFFIETPVWNNAFSYEKRGNKKLYVPALKKIKHFDEIELWNEIVFEEDDWSGSITGYTGLKNFYEIDFLPQTDAKVYLFDNHNHAYFFWHLSHLQKIIWGKNTLYHIDEHADMRSPEIFLDDTTLHDIQNIFTYTNFTLNVGNYIIPAEKDWLIEKTYQLRSETALLELLKKEKLEENILLNIDLDFFHPDLDFIPYALKKEVILKLAKRSKLITIATSPYFINQSLAVKVFKDIFS